ncbi:uncharacterized protein B0P05DRAFT_533947 [Gilbertella persicaria]|uniref:Uncharacterized protein n=1 Tax=Rhizopus stolonifer TaxID=4846 RepID=A0A367KKV3_RHIST|nr:uncharacterized protein B0P05DRAFT_533947 [Gilbertella persicaria]KAI8085844.1 hypothetical protein B0P05DRAFT_533947 [Gilbertella persicaria]RCI02797.1 hypothetical protein CU098_011646 [Rhizopus stolonifer]
MEQQQQLLGQPYYNNNSNSMNMEGQQQQPYTQQQQAYHFNGGTSEQQYVISPSNFNATEIQPQSMNQPYPSIDFFYETPHIQPTMTTSTDLSKNYTNSTSNNFQIPISNTNNATNTMTRPSESSTAVSSVDEDYVQNLANELQHTKQLLNQYQLRTEQLMELVKKQTDKIAELRDQLNNKANPVES